MVLLQHACVFFRRFLESRNHKIQVVAHVGGESAVVLSGRLEASYWHFFYRARFQLFTQQFPVFVDRLQKLSLTSLQAPRGWKNRTLLEEFYTF